jgi:hypothetical protein
LKVTGVRKTCMSFLAAIHIHPKKTIFNRYLESSGKGGCC